MSCHVGKFLIEDIESDVRIQYENERGCMWRIIFPLDPSPNKTMRCRGFSLAILAAVVASPVTLADSNLHRRQSVTFRSAGVIPKRADDNARQVSVDIDVPRGGASPATSVSFVSQSASILMSLILAMNSGFINGCALSGAVTADGSMQAVAAVTASWTNSALTLAGGNAAKCAFFAKVIGSFIFGSMIAGYMEPTPSQFLVSSKNYGGPLTVAAGAVALATVFLQDLGKVKLGFYLLAVANGINNSVTSVSIISKGL